MLTRSGTTIPELLVSLTLTAIILAIATGGLFRQQRVAAGMTASAESAGQVRMALALLPAQLGLSAGSSADLVRGEVRDTALQLRATVATAFACDTAGDPSFALDDDGASSAGVASPPHEGDTLWWYHPDSARWRGLAVESVRTDSSACPAATSASGASRHRVMHMDVGGDDTIPRFAPLRVTRQTRLVVYRSGDGSWQLGLREWSATAHALAAPQPVAGPLLRVAADGARTGFRYFDPLDAELHPETDPAAVARVARIRFTALSTLPVTPGPYASPGARDSVDVVLRPVATP